MTEAWPPLGPEYDDYDGDWERYCTDCYELYSRDFLASKPPWPIDGKRFNIKRQPMVEGRCHTFWHIITEGDDEASRTPNFDRAARVTWARAILEEFARLYPATSSSRIVWWIEKRGGEDRIHIALADFSYLVVVADRGEYVLLWTAFPIERDHQRRRRRLAFERYWAGKS